MVIPLRAQCQVIGSNSAMLSLSMAVTQLTAPAIVGLRASNHLVQILLRKEQADATRRPRVRLPAAARRQSPPRARRQGPCSILARRNRTRNRFVVCFAPLSRCPLTPPPAWAPRMD